MIKKSILAAALVTIPLSAAAIPIETIFPIVSMNLSGQGSLPLAYEPGSATEDYGFVDSSVSVTLDPLRQSRLVSTVDVPDSLADPVGIALDFELYLQLDFADNAPGSGNDYTGTLAPAFTLTPLDPLVLSVTGEVDFSNVDLNDPLGTTLVGSTASASTIKELLGVDVNQNGDEDFIQFTVDDFVFDEDSLLFDFVDENDPGAGVAITSASLMLSGQVADVTTDPPFSIALSTTPPAAIPLPAAAWLFATGLIGIFGLSRRKRAVSGH